MKKLIIGYLLMGILLIGGCGSNNAPENSVDAVGSFVEGTETAGEDTLDAAVASSGPADNSSTSSESKDNKEIGETKETGETKESGETKETGETKESGGTKEAGESKETAKATKQTDKGTAKESSSPSTQAKSTESSKSGDEASQETRKEESRSPQENNSKNSGSSTPEPAHTSCTWDGGKVTTAAGCGSGGEKTYTCTVCGKTRTESIPASGHSMTTETTAPTCTAAGKTKTYCTSCGYVESETANGSPTGHVESSECFLPPTCDYGGSYVYHCSVCGENLGTREGTPLGHSWDGGEKGGSPCWGYVTIYTCTVCGWQEKVEEDGTGCVDIDGDGVCDNCHIIM